MPSGGFATRKRRDRRMKNHDRLVRLNERLVKLGVSPCQTITQAKRILKRMKREGATPVHTPREEALPEIRRPGE